MGTAMVFRFGALPCTCNVQLRNVEIGESKGNQQEVGCGKRFQCVNQFNAGKMWELEHDDGDPSLCC